MRIAVSYQEEQIGEHFSTAGCFAIYEYENADVTKATRHLIKMDGSRGAVELMQAEGVDVVICGNMSGTEKAELLSVGIVPISGYAGGAEKVADLLAIGELPIISDDAFDDESFGGCAGCSGCSSAGSCGSCSSCGC